MTDDIKCNSWFRLGKSSFHCEHLKGHKGQHKFLIVWNDEDEVK